MWEGCGVSGWPLEALDGEGEELASVVAPPLGRQRSRVAAVLYGSAAALVAVSLLISWDAHDDPGRAWLVVGAAALAAVAFAVLAARGVDLPVWVHGISAAVGSVMVAMLVEASGPTFAASYGLLVLYVAAFSLYYFSVRHALVQVAIAGGAYAVALATMPGVIPRVSYWLLVVGACGIGSGLVGVLGHRTRRLLEREQAVVSRLAELDRSKDGFLRVVAHDLRGPLTTIVGNAELIATRLSELDADTVEDLARRQARQGRRLERLVGDLLDLEGLRSRALHPVRRLVDLADVVERLAATIEPAGRPVRVEVEPARVLGDEVLLERAVDNVLANAFKHTPADSPIDVELAHRGEEVRLAVADRGPGVPPERRETIFELYSSEEGGHTAGVGLALVKEIVHAHDGRVSVAERPGGGTTFTLVFPARTGRAAPPG